MHRHAVIQHRHQRGIQPGQLDVPLNQDTHEPEWEEKTRKQPIPGAIQVPEYRLSGSHYVSLDSTNP